MGVAADNQRISDVIQRERRRLFQFIRQWVADEWDAEDILQDVFSELTEAYRLMKPVERAGVWLYRVARNRIIDRFRKNRPRTFSDLAAGDDDLPFEDLLPSPEDGPEAEYARNIWMAEIEAALDELPPEQRDVFVAHEIEGRSFRELAAETGLSVNTLLSRKHYAVLHLRRRLADIYQEFKRGGM